MAKKVTKTAKASKSKTATKVAAPAKGNGKTTVLKTICAELGIDTKTARRVLRKRMRSDTPEIAQFHTIKTRWVQSAKDAGTIKQVLKGYLETREAA